MKTSLGTRSKHPSQALFAPLRILREEMDDLIQRFSREWDADWVNTGLRLPVDVIESPDTVELRVDAPGMKPEDISIEVTGDSVKISGERKEEQEETGKTYHHVERRVGQFCETLRLPCSVKEDKVHAELKDGVLKLVLPKSEDARTHQVKIKSNGLKS